MPDPEPLPRPGEGQPPPPVPPRAVESTVVEAIGPASVHPAQPSMAMDELRSNYEAILRAGAIYYPVAYQFLHELGRGRQGIVYLCLRQGARGCVTQHAIKIFDPGIYRAPEEYWTDMGRLASQISKLQGLQSPNLVPRHSYDETYGIGYSQMEAIDGMDLRGLLNGDHLDMARRHSTDEEWSRFLRTLFRVEGRRISLQPGLVVYILRRMVRGIERLHAMNFLHSDVKPANVMIDRLGTIRIVDFGRAVMIGEKVTFLFGSPMYMAPEIHRREPGRPQSDLYSIGLVGLEMLRGEPVADPELADEDALLRLKLELPGRLPDMLPPALRDEGTLIRIVRRLLDPQIESRFASAKEADVGSDGLIVTDVQFTRRGLSADTGRVLSEYMSKLVDPRTGRVETPERASRLGSESHSQRVGASEGSAG
jgi:eukaryotic-like serine/threonine-protein kinase